MAAASAWWKSTTWEPRNGINTKAIHPIWSTAPLRAEVILAFFFAGAALTLPAPMVCAAPGDVWVDPKTGIRTVEMGPSNGNGNSSDNSGHIPSSSGDDAKHAERNRQYDDIRRQVEEVWGRGDFREALRLLKRQQKMRDGPIVREDIAKIKALIVQSEAKEKYERERLKQEAREARAGIKREAEALKMLEKMRKKHCSEMKQQLARDQKAMRRQQKSIEQGQAELADWTTKNKAAEEAALKRATNFLVDSLMGQLGEFAEGRLAKLESNFKQRGPLGETWRRKIQKVQEFRAKEARLKGAIDGIKLTRFRGAAADGWREIKEWAVRNRKDAETLDAILSEWRRDPALQEILKESGISTVSAGLGFVKTLEPWTTALDFGHFCVLYFNDAADWTTSRNRITQQIANSDNDLKALAALKKQIERTVANLEACESSKTY